MKSGLIVILIAILPIVIKAQNIISVYGGGTSYGTDGIGDGLHADSASLNDPTQELFDIYGNYYVCEGLGNRIREVNKYGIINTIAGNGSSIFNGDGGLADTSAVTTAGAICDTVGNLYIADGYFRVRKVDKVTNIISTIAGNGTMGNSGDGGQATSAELNGASDVCFDKFGNFYIADATNHKIRKVDNSGIITTYAGNGVNGSSGDGGPATAAEMEFPRSITTDDTGNLYISDLSANRVRKVNKSGVIFTFAGTGNGIYNGNNMPATVTNINPVQLTIDMSGNFFIADFYNNVIWKADKNNIIHIVAGNTVEGNFGDGGLADSAELDGIGGIAIDTCGNIYISQVNNPRIRKVPFNPTCIPARMPNITGTNIAIYPNPATEIINVNGLTTREEYALLNITGIIEQQGELKAGDNTLDVRWLPPGLYVLEMTDEDGNRTVNKIIKQ